MNKKKINSKPNQNQNPNQKFGHIITEPPASERGRTISRISVAKGSNLNFRGRKSNSLMNLCGKAPIQILFLFSPQIFVERIKEMNEKIDLSSTLTTSQQMKYSFFKCVIYSKTSSFFFLFYYYYNFFQFSDIRICCCLCVFINWFFFIGL